MTDKDKAHQLGEVIFEIRQEESDLNPLIVRAKMIGATLVRVGEQLRDRPFGVASAEAHTIPNSVGNGTFATERGVFDYDALEALERDIQARVRELHRLRGLKAQLEP